MIVLPTAMPCATILAWRLRRRGPQAEGVHAALAADLGRQKSSMSHSRFTCPACETLLVQRRHQPGASYVCDGCGGAALTIPVIRQHARPVLANAIWNGLRASQAPSSRKCPGCERTLRSFEVDSEGTTELDGCVTCHFLWFDNAELSRLAISFKDPPPIELRRAIADMQVEAIGDIGRTKATADTIRKLLYYWYWMT